jgi:hypothetical protein
MNDDPQTHSSLQASSPDWVEANGLIVRGHGVASGTGPDRRYPAGTLSLQRPFFAQLGLDLSAFYDGTVNVDLAPRSFSLARPTYTFRAVAWTFLHPPEDFSFSHCRLIHRARPFDGWVYTPHPETKAAHFQPPTLLEIIAPFIPNLAAGDPVRLLLPPHEIILHEPADHPLSVQPPLVHTIPS